MMEKIKSMFLKNMFRLNLKRGEVSVEEVLKWIMYVGLAVAAGFAIVRIANIAG